MADSKLVTYENYTSNMTKKDSKEIRYLVPHCYACVVSTKNGVDAYCNTSRQVSSQYVIGKDGTIGQAVLEKDRAWTTGGSKTVAGWSGSQVDHYGITVEISSESSAPVKMTDASIEVFVNLAIDICKRYNRTKLVYFGDDATKTMSYSPKSNELVIALHRWFAVKTCPGDYFVSKLPTIVERVNKALTATTSSTETQKSATATSSKYKVGDTMELISDAKYTSGKSIPAWVIKSTLYVREIQSNGNIVFSTKKSGAITGVVEPSQIKAPFEAYVGTVTAPLNVRTGPGFTYSKTGIVIKKGEKYTIVEEKNGFGKLKSGAGWVYLHYIKKG